MAEIFAKNALLPGGWAANVRLTIADDLIGAVERDASPMPADEAPARHPYPRNAEPAQPRLPARHGRADRKRGPEDDGSGPGAR